MIKGGENKHLLAFCATFDLNFSNCFWNTKESYTTPLRGNKIVLSNHSARETGGTESSSYLTAHPHGSGQKGNLLHAIKMDEEKYDVTGNNS